MEKILYISLTGMTEPLGRSQVLEYLVDLSTANKIYLISFEREKDIENLKEIELLSQQYGIEWHHFIYSNRYGVFSTVNQIIKAIRFSSHWIKENNIKVIHARSMIPATIGFLLKKIYGIKLLFDIRGFSIDEKVDSGRLRKNSLLFKLLKKLDDHLYLGSDHVVTLTHEAKNMLHENLGVSTNKVTVIPTCASKEIFKVISEKEKRRLKLLLGFNLDDKVVIHTGTILNRYDFTLEIKLFKALFSINHNYKFLIVNKGEHEIIRKKLLKEGVREGSFIITSSSFDLMYQYLNVADIAFFFIPPTYAKKAMAPTKFAENVACLLPSVTNDDIGDMGYYLQRYNVGHIVNLHSLKNNLEEEAKKILVRLSQQDFTQSDFTTLFNEHFDKKIAINKYQQIYEKLS